MRIRRDNAIKFLSLFRLLIQTVCHIFNFSKLKVYFLTPFNKSRSVMRRWGGGKECQTQTSWVPHQIFLRSKTYGSYRCEKLEDLAHKQQCFALLNILRMFIYTIVKNLQTLSAGSDEFTFVRCRRSIFFFYQTTLLNKNYENK